MTVGGLACVAIIGANTYQMLSDKDNLAERSDDTPPINVSTRTEARVDNNKATIIFCDDNLSPKYALSPEKEAPVLLDEYKNAGEPVIYASEPLLYRGNIANAYTPNNPQEPSTQWYLKKSDGSVVTLNGEQVKQSRQALLKVTMDNVKNSSILKHITQQGR